MTRLTVHEYAAALFQPCEVGDRMCGKLLTAVIPDLLPAFAAGDGPGRLRAELERVGTPLSEPDLRIAAIALTHDLTVVTGNVRHFARVPGLQVETWLQ